MMKRIINHPDMCDPLNRYVGAKTYSGNMQTGFVVRLPNPSPEEAIANAEARCVTSLNLYERRMPTWDGQEWCQ